MNLALIHDRLHIKTFWEKRIDNDSRHAESEEQRRGRSALSKLRGEWLVRLENRTKHLKSLNDTYVKKAKVEQPEEQKEETEEQPEEEETEEQAEEEETEEQAEETEEQPEDET